MINFIRFFALIALGLMFLCAPSLAQEDNVTSATSALQEVLTNLKLSVQKLSLDNDQLTSKDNDMKQQVMHLQLELGQIEAQGEQLNKAVSKFQGINPGRAQEIADLEEENSGLDNRIQKTQNAISLVQQSLGAGYQEDQTLLMRLRGMQHEAPSDLQPTDSQTEAHRQKEKLKLMKMIYDCQQRQEDLHESIMDIQKNTSLLPAASAMAHQQLLKEQIKDLENQMAGYPAQVTSAGMETASQWDDNQLRQLESELKTLEQNYSQLKSLMEQMGKKAQAAKMNVNQHVEEDKLQGSLDDMKHQGVSLMTELDDLRTQMVDLDKRKSSLEEMIRRMQ